MKESYKTNYNPELFSQRLQIALSKRTLTQAELSRRTGISEASLSRYVNGARAPRILHLVNLASTLDVSADYLLGKLDLK